MSIWIGVALGVASPFLNYLAHSKAYAKKPAEPNVTPFP
jgi:hypothetical protein